MKGLINNSILKIAGTITIVAFFAVGCEKKEEITKTFYISSISDSTQCGFMLRDGVGGNGSFHDSFYWADDIPEEFRILNLGVGITYNLTDKTCNNYPIINIISIKKL